ncbi:MAG: RES domain-containing protein [Mesorhizobium sp.]|nr:MAG: RES domain-containing protein [Mesorhizobium sp.]RWN08785.1 MAG: RES domain-containing protein [Mesorhizobium sp.]RWN16210.1 MAG: RES domain-containing protein [Mesorhizobium sp.]TIQ97488.1 MAG: RES domain-containing protein [Mesorhizobium sp.]
MIVVPSPPPSPVCNILALPAGTELHRVHSRDRRAHEFNPGFGSSRFAPFKSAGKEVPTMYLGTSFGCAAYESIFHDIDPSAAFKSVPMSKVDECACSVVKIDRDLKLGRLFEPDLNKWTVTRQTLIDTPPSSYVSTRIWAQAIHDANPTLDGMIWTSRRFDEDQCLILFGTRVDQSSIDVVSTGEFASSPLLLDHLVDLGRLSGIVLTL